ncbi:ribosomal protein S18 [Saitoella complicata NRRL Y-17804]|nr:ribosomal protein S18 [Saitoella complicata NRRL Y-17804]ODQ50129.1 ribosomal protein S18 [Saitoella complicata NRRL Y-17804]
MFRSSLRSVQSVCSRATFSTSARVCNTTSNEKTADALFSMLSQIKEDKPADPTSTSTAPKLDWQATMDKKSTSGADALKWATQQSTEDDPETPIRLSRNTIREFSYGQTYEPRDFSFEKAEEVRLDRRHKRGMVKRDRIEALGVNPEKEWKNPFLLNAFVTEMGRIRPASDTGISAKNQRRVARAIKRARAFGVMPVYSKFQVSASNTNRRNY